MMRKLASIMVLLALCVPAFAVDMPNMVGNWTGTAHGVSWHMNTDYQATGKPIYWDDKYTITIDEQNGTRFSGKMVRVANPLNSVVLLGVIGSDNKTITAVDENRYYWGSMKSPKEIELSSSTIDMDRISLEAITFTKG